MPGSGSSYLHRGPLGIVVACVVLCRSAALASKKSVTLGAIALAVVASASFVVPPGQAGPLGRVADDASGAFATDLFGPGQDRYIVKFRGGARGPDAVAARDRTLELVERQTGVRVRELRTLATGARVVQTGTPLNGPESARFMDALGARADVEYVEPDVMMTHDWTPNDPRYGEQGNYRDTVGGARLPTAWDRVRGEGAVVAVLDTGITSHPDLSANLVSGYDFISDSEIARDGGGRDADPSDPGDWSLAGECDLASAHNSSWHGTHVSGTVAAVTNNSTGVAGVAPKGKIQPVRVLGKCGGFLSDIADAAVWASGGSVSGVPVNRTPADIVNMSLGGGGACSNTFQSAIKTAVGNGTVVVVAAGNENQDASAVQPANCQGVVSVAAVDKQGNRASFSNYGAVVDVAAPGTAILSTLNSGTTTRGQATYGTASGTSMATPHVSGLAALMVEARAGLTPAQIKVRLESGARAMPGTCAGGCGAGIIDARATIASLSVSRVAGQDRYATAARVAASYPAGVDVVYLASGRNFPDALAGAALAGKLDSPVLLTEPGGLPGPTRTALTALAPQRIVILGGPNTVSTTVETQAAAYATAASGKVSRVAGQDRYATAARVAASYPAGVDVVYLASGRNFPDALAGAALAGKLDSPVLLTEPGGLPGHTRTALTALAPQRIVILGGPNTVSTTVETQAAAYATAASGKVSRVAGQDRYATAARVAASYPAGVDVVYLASGRNFPDALAGAALAGKLDSPVLLTEPGGLPGHTRTALTALAPQRIVILGGPNTVSTTVEQALASYLD